jgi:putative spermidine/putrescine transport system permease protein
VKMMRRRNWVLFLILLPFIIFIIGFEIGPIIAMVSDSFRADDGHTLSLVQYFTIFTNDFYLIAIKNSLIISFFSSIVGIMVAILAAYSITRLSSKAQDRILMFSNMTSNFAGVPLAFAYIIIMGNNGLFTLLFHKLGWSLFSTFDLYSWTGLILVYIYFQIPLAVMLLYPTYFGIQEQWKEAASLLGASPLNFWRYIGIPIILPGIAGTLSILFANAMGAYATAYALVGSNYNLLAIRIGALVSGDVYTRPQLGGALAVLLGVMMILSMWFNERMMRRVRRDLQ